MLQSGGPWDQTGNSVCNACADKIMYVHYSVIYRYAIVPNYPPNSSTATMDSCSLSYGSAIFFFFLAESGLLAVSSLRMTSDAALPRF